jgi:hypothetical protein
MTSGSVQTDARTHEREIEDAKLMLDGARDIFEHTPTTEFARVVDECEEHLNDLLDQYPRDGAARSAPSSERN